MTSQGWVPGMYLGAQNAAYVDNYTVASASHIRVTLKDDNLGLGARPKGGLNSEPTGLDAFQGLLGRLNGRSQQELDKEQKRREDAKIAVYVQRRWRGPTFISGGLLVQADWNDSQKKDSFSNNNNKGAHEDCEREDKEVMDVETTTVPQATLTQRSEPDDPSSVPSQVLDNSRFGERMNGLTRKGEKKTKKRKDCLRGGIAPKFDIPSNLEARPRKSSVQAGETSPAITSITSSVPKRPIPVGRQLIRGRHIHQKRKALMDDKSLSEIFMVKS